MKEIWNDCPLCGDQLSRATNKFNYEKINNAFKLSDDAILSIWPNTIACFKCENYAVLCNREGNIEHQLAILDDNFATEIYKMQFTINYWKPYCSSTWIDFTLSKYALNKQKLLNLVILK